MWDWIIPKRCIGCGREGKYICENCEVGIWEADQICPGCRRLSRYGLTHKYCREKTALEGLTVLWTYEGLVPKIIRGVKYKWWKDMLGEIVKEVEMDDYKDAIWAPVPLHKEREKWRGFNQAREIAKLLVEREKIKDLLIRKVNTKPQTQKGRKERLEAMKDVFDMNPKYDASSLKQVVIVDDVWTTGATMNECAKVIKAKLPTGSQVWGFTLAR